MTAQPPRGAWGRWLTFLGHREPGTSLALFRIACGLCVLYTLGSPLLHGLASVLWLDRADGGYHDLGEPPWLFRLVGGLHPSTFWPMFAAGLVAALALTAGLGGRVAALLTLLPFKAITDANPSPRGCDDYLLCNALWLLVLADSTATLSLRCRLRTGHWTSDRLVSAWPRYLVIYQIVLVYWATGMQKVSLAWTPLGDGSALYYILQEPVWQRTDMTWIAHIYPLIQFLTIATWLWEVTAPLVLLAFWYRATRD